MTKFSEFKFKRHLGQNFLWDLNVAKKIVDAISLAEDDFVVEVGVGKGVLTKYLIQFPVFYLGYEIDEDLKEYLQNFSSESFAKYFAIHFQDFLTISEAQLSVKFGKKILLVGNIPYNITSRIIFKILDNLDYYSRAVLLVQKEVADRFVAAPGCKEYGILSVLLQVFAQVKKHFDVARTCFVPKPKVDSSLVEIILNESTAKIENIDYEEFKNIVRIAFNQRRKKLANSLFKRIGLDDEVVSSSLLSKYSNCRSDELTPMDFIEISSFLKHQSRNG
ncbi:MAG: 16S rRNA (adenine(1518)-N(6)/adenine(1519)-N(6))-dimethyltransferase RsmA [Ignavibacteria bacterium]|nr:16S rRNA (adenine(1518)-N(6)/adenine(1519)-N(6))-dimethyltransferase RsmA [Ignavibacteria bacterium]